MGRTFGPAFFLALLSALLSASPASAGRAAFFELDDPPAPETFLIKLTEHLDDVGGAFLPGRVWCPWGARLLREVTR